MFEIGGREGRVRAKEAKDQLGNETKRERGEAFERRNRGFNLSETSL